MNTDTKVQLKSLGKTTGVIGLGAALVAGVTWLVLPAKPRTVTMSWDYPTNQLGGVMFEIVSKTNLNDPWQFKTNIIGTNVVKFEKKSSAEFYTISRVIDVEVTNNFIRQKGF